MGFSGTIGVAFKSRRVSFVIKSQLVLKVADRFLHIRNRAVERAVNVVLDEIVSAMARKHRVELRGFGAFYSKDRAGRIARNPGTGVKVEVPEKSVPVFRASKEMGKRLNPAAPMPSTRDGALGFTSK